jgi:hypothetical protein
LRRCLIDGGDVSPLARCKGLRHLIGNDITMSIDVMRAIGGNLRSLKCEMGLDGLEEIVEYCPNLENLDIFVKDEEGNWLDNEPRLTAGRLINSGLKKLARLVINGITIRSGKN